MRKLFLFVTICLFSLCVSYAHSGRTDSSGGHRDNKRGGYHYHCGGNPAHSHKNGTCPYAAPKKTATPVPKNTDASNSKDSTVKSRPQNRPNQER